MVDKLRSYELAPSKRLDTVSFSEVSGALFEELDVRSLHGLIFSTPYTSPAATPTPTCPTNILIKSLQSVYEAIMPELNQKEACGVPLLGSFVAYLATELNKIINNSGFTEFPLVLDVVKSGAKPASDSAIAKSVYSDKKLISKPIVLYEYKPTVYPRSNHVNRHFMMEVLIQAYYCLYQYKVPTFIHCLTDLHQWYYLKVDKVKPSKLKIVWYKSINEKELSLDTHLSFLHFVLVDISQMLDITM